MLQMNRIKDFFYNQNDIIVVLIILLAAAVVIYDRMGVIMEYPQTVATQTSQQQAEGNSQNQSDNTK